MPYLPPTLQPAWAKLKHDLVPTLEKMRDPKVSPQDLKERVRKVESLYSEFDQGLSAKLKAVNACKNDKDAAVALKSVLDVVRNYRESVRRKKSDWGISGSLIADLFDGTLRSIEEACQHLLSAMGHTH